MEGSGTGAPYPGRVGSPVPEPPGALLSRSTMSSDRGFFSCPEEQYLFRATWRELDLDIYKIFDSHNCNR